MKMMGMKCRECGSKQVGADLSSEWNAALQTWDAVGDLDGRVCNDCGADGCIEEYELTGQELADAMHERRMCGIDDLLSRIQAVRAEAGAIGNIVLPDLLVDICAIRAKLYQFAATMAEHDKLVDALALTLPYAETRAADLLDAKLNNEPEYGPGFIEDESCPGADEAASVVEHAGRVLASYGAESRLLERGQRAGGAE